VIEDPDAASPQLRASLEGEVDFFDAVALGTRTEFRLGASRTSTEQETLAGVHHRSLVFRFRIRCATVI